MKHRMPFYLLLVFFALVLLLTGCESGGNLKIINRTSYPLYAGIRGNLYTIGADSSLFLKFSTPNQSFFTNDTGIYVDTYLSGETFQIWDAYLQAFVDTAYIWINTGKTTKVYADPNRACIKVVNNSDWNIKKIIVQRNTISTTVTTPYDVFLTPGQAWFRQQQPADNTNQFYYIVQIQFENDDILSYGDENNILYKDDQFLVTVEQPD